MSAPMPTQTEIVRQGRVDLSNSLKDPKKLSRFKEVLRQRLDAAVATIEPDATLTEQIVNKAKEKKEEKEKKKAEAGEGAGEADELGSEDIEPIIDIRHGRKRFVTFTIQCVIDALPLSIRDAVFDSRPNLVKSLQAVEAAIDNADKAIAGFVGQLKESEQIHEFIMGYCADLDCLINQKKLSELSSIVSGVADFVQKSPAMHGPVDAPDDERLRPGPVVYWEEALIRQIADIYLRHLQAIPVSSNSSAIGADTTAFDQVCDAITDCMNGPHGRVLILRLPTRKRAIDYSYKNFQKELKLKNSN